jgi:hypothetical protein
LGKEWLERHPHWTFHFTSASWLNAVEGYPSVPFRWTKDPAKIIVAVKRGYHVVDSMHELIPLFIKPEPAQIVLEVHWNGIAL